MIIASIYASATDVPLEITAKKVDDTAHISIKGFIYNWSKASSTELDRQIQQLKSKGAIKAAVYINTGGGDCFEAEEIWNLIEDNFEEYKFRVGALAASAGTYFLTKGHVTCKRNSKFMIHKPMGRPEGNEDQIESGLKLVKEMTNTYRTAYATKMDISEDEVDKLWSKGDYWMSAAEAKKKGLVDVIEDQDEVIDATTKLQLVACGAPGFESEPPPITTPTSKTTKNKSNTRMELPILAATLGLPPEATQAEVDAKLTALKADSALLETLKTQNEQKEKQEKEAKIKAMLDKAEQDKKIDATTRASFETLASSDYESCKTVLDSMKPLEAASKQITPKATNPDGAPSTATNRDNWTFEDYQKCDDPSVWDTFEEQNPEKAAALIEAHYSRNEE